MTETWKRFDQRKKLGSLLIEVSGDERGALQLR